MTLIYAMANILPTSGTSPMSFDMMVKSTMSRRRAAAFMSHGTGFCRALWVYAVPVLYVGVALGEG